MNTHIGLIKELRAKLADAENTEQRRALRHQLDLAIADKTRHFRQMALDDDDHFILNQD